MSNGASPDPTASLASPHYILARRDTREADEADSNFKLSVSVLKSVSGGLGPMFRGDRATTHMTLVSNDVSLRVK